MEISGIQQRGGPTAAAWGRRAAWALLAGWLGLGPAQAQDKVSLKDAKEMTYQAQSTVEGLQSLLNYVTFNDNTPSELAEVMSSSYKASRNQLFFGKDIIVEDDLSAAAARGNTKDLTAEKYLHALDLQYAKTADASIAFSNLTVSKIKKKDFVYVTVRFDETFGSKEKASGKSYPVRQREALLRLVSQGTNQWQALIAGLNFYDPAHPTESTENELPITSGGASETTLVSAEDFVREKDDFVLAKQQEEKRKQAAFDEYVALGSSSSANKQYKDALELFYKAKELRPLVPALDKRILDTKRLMGENTYESWKIKADQAKNERRHTDALRYYKEALALKPDARPVLDPEIALLTKRLNEIALPRNKLESGDVEGALAACDNILKENKKTKNDFPEIYLLKAQAYQLAAEKLPGDTHAPERALENFALAIQYYPTFGTARLARAAFYVKHKRDYAGAITDYDVLTTNTPDDAPEKPGYFVLKGKWKEQVKNTAGALDDYARAIALSRDAAPAHLATAELLYRLGRYPEALGSFDTAVRLDPKASKHFYGRGLNRVATNDLAKAGEDFATAEGLGLEPAQLQKVEAISAGYFDEAQKAAKARRLARADSLYDKALAVRGCNARAWHGKAELRLAAAEELTRKQQAAAGDYQQAEELYQKAIGCNPKYSDAYYKKGLAYHRTGDYAQAVQSYTDAIRTDANGVVAYLGRGGTHLTTQQYSAAIADYSQAAMTLQNNLTAAKKNSAAEAVVAGLTNELAKTNGLLGETFYRKKEYMRAVLMTNKALVLNKKNTEALYYQGLAYEALREPAKALVSYASALEYAPQGKYYYANGRALLHAAKYEQAIGSLSAALLRDSAQALKNIYHLRGLSYFKSRQLELAAKDFAEYGKYTTKTDSAFFADSGLLNLHLNRDVAAVASFKQALAARPDHPAALFGLGCAYAKAGQFELALEQLALAYQTRRLQPDEMKLEEETFLAELNKVKAHKAQYAQLKKTYLPAAK